MFKPDPAYTKRRVVANKALLKILGEYLTKYPDQRFGQALANLDIVLRGQDPFNEEPWDTLVRAQNVQRLLKNTEKGE